jgi:hypothetical protein
MSSPVLIWFRLFDSDGKQWSNTTAAYIFSLSLVIPLVHEFRKAVLKMYNDEGSTILTGIASSQLLVYRDKSEQSNLSVKEITTTLTMKVVINYRSHYKE